MIGVQNMTNCVNCGAPIETDKKVCPYCKTPYDVSGFKAEIGECSSGKSRLAEEQAEYI